MKKSLLFASLLTLVLTLASCGGNSQKNDGESTDISVISVDEVLADPDAIVGDTIVIEGVCSHLCRHGGRKAFVAGSADSLMLRCEAYPLMGQPFPKSTVHHPIQVTGILREQRIDEAAVVEMEKQNAERLGYIAREQGDESAEIASRAESGCDTERAAQGQKDLSTFSDRMADYRARIAARQEKEGKPYLSFYYLDAISYQSLDE